MLRDDELKAIWKPAVAMPWPFGPIVLLLILTGQRREEVAGMRWSELDLHKRLWTLPRSRVKNDTEHTVPLSEAAVEIIKAVRRIKNVDFVFSTTGRNPVSGFSKFKDRLDEAAAVPDWRLHDIRRTVASGMARLGITLDYSNERSVGRSGRVTTD